MTELVLKQFEKPLRKGWPPPRFPAAFQGLWAQRLAGVVQFVAQFIGASIGRATYQPGWRWSEHAGKAAGLALCPVEHLGIVLSGRAMVAMKDGTTVEMHAGDVFHIGPGHDSWVVGDEPYVSLHFHGAEAYSRHWQRR